MTKDEALRLALEALEMSDICADDCKCTRKRAINAIKAALEAKDEPVALAWAEGYRMGIADERTSEANIGIAGFNAKVEPDRENPYITTPPQRTWVGLTQDERINIGYKANGNEVVAVELTEAKLKEKNA